MTMATLDRGASSRGFLPTPLARIGLIIPSSNRLTEPQLRHFAPRELGIHVTRLQMTGKWNRPLSALGDYIRRIGLAVVHDVALALPGSDQYLAEPPERWVALAVEHARDDADGYFLSCTNTTQIEAIEPIEWRLGKPVVNSNQAVLWACMKRLRAKLGGAEPAPGLGRLF